MKVEKYPITSKKMQNKSWRNFRTQGIPKQLRDSNNPKNLYRPFFLTIHKVETIFLQFLVDPSI
jgi:hypothetical protein